MFTGIIEQIAKVIKIEQQQSNLRFTIKSKIASELQIDQSVAHDGVCLTITSIDGDYYSVDVIDETLQKTTLSLWKPNKMVNIERSITMNKRLDGHVVQGHIDSTMQCEHIEEVGGSWVFRFVFQEQFAPLMIHKGSICINGVSLTIAALDAYRVSVAIIPYTYKYTTFHTIKVGDMVNVEFDVLGKYVHRIMTLQAK